MNLYISHSPIMWSYKENIKTRELKKIINKLSRFRGGDR